MVRAAAACGCVISVSPADQVNVRLSCYANPPFPTYSFQMRPRRQQR
jgi:hypothetical protein